jgi:hypothetical protein
MNQDLALVAVMLVVLLSAVAGIAYLASRPRIRLTLWTQGGGEVRKNIGRATDHYIWTDPTDKKKVYIPLLREFAKQGARGLSYYADATSGRLVKLVQKGKEVVMMAAAPIDPSHIVFPKSEWDVMDPKYLASALEDGRERKLVAAQKGGLEAFKNVILILGVLGFLAIIAIAVMVFQLYQARPVVA